VIASTAFLSVMIIAALAITMTAPVVLLYFFYQDWKNGELW